MNDGILFERINTIPPLINTSTNKRQAAIAVTETSTATNLAALIPKVVNGHYVELTADGADIYYAFADSDSAEVDPEATADDPKVCQVLTDGSTKTVRIIGGYTYVVAMVESGAAVLRVAVASLRYGHGPENL